MGKDTDEFQIAKAMANILYKLTNGDDDSLPKEEEEQLCRLLEGEKYSNSLLTIQALQLAKLHGLTAKLAMAKAKQFNQDFQSVMKQTEFAVSIQLAKLLAPTMDPLLGSLKEVAIEKEGEICGVCQEEMEKAEAVVDVCEAARTLHCGHIFHLLCISKWLEQNMICPLCRQKHEITIR